MRHSTGLLSLLLLATLADAQAPANWPPKESPYPVNPNQLIGKHHAELKLSASSTWPGWPIDKAFDRDLTTAWFSAADDIARNEKKDQPKDKNNPFPSTGCERNNRTGPWIQATFPADVTVRRVTILSNREVIWVGYQVLAGKVELLDADGKVLASAELTAKGDARDLDYSPKEAIKSVRSVKFTVLADEGGKNVHNDIGIAEMQVD